MHSHHQHFLPCLHCHPHTYIRMVQHLIERCLLLHMSRRQCVKALSDHANISPLITLTVWRGLQKENWEFFQAYHQSISSRSLIARRYSINDRERLPRRRKQWFSRRKGCK